MWFYAKISISLLLNFSLVSSSMQSIMHKSYASRVQQNEWFTDRVFRGFFPLKYLFSFLQCYKTSSKSVLFSPPVEFQITQRNVPVNVLEGIHINVTLHILTQKKRDMQNITFSCQQCFKGLLLTDPFRWMNVYKKSKLSGEYLCNAMHHPWCSRTGWSQV